MKRIYVARGSVDADLIRCRLQEVGIDAVVREISGPASGEGSPSVWVPEREETHALAVLEGTDRAPDA